ncbi:MAG: extracellular solute-binding protein [Kiritimatiellae bacterium]|nr:extracellular solute-binding protein [Kiritimatiellia bacterium]
MPLTLLNKEASRRPLRGARLRAACGCMALTGFSLLAGVNPQAASTTGAGQAQDGTIAITVEGYRPDEPDSAAVRVCAALAATTAKEHAADPAKPVIRVLPWSGMSMPGPAGRAPRLMALAGGIAADVLNTFWHETRMNIDEGYLMPLNEYIGHDLNGNGWIDDDEAIWPTWKNIHPYSKLVATVNGKVYALPDGTTYYQSLVIRTDLFRAAGLDPNKPPRDWDEFFYMCQKLTDPGREVPGARFQRGQRAILLTQNGWQWIAWLWCAGGQTLTQYRTDPATGREYAFPELEIEFKARDPATGQSVNLRQQPSRWQATFGSEAGVQACEFFHRLMWSPWIRLPNGEPMNLTAEDVARGWATDPDSGRRVDFHKRHVIFGVARPSRREEASLMDLFRNGEVAIVQATSNQLLEYNMPPDNLSFFPVPPRTTNDTPHAMFFRHMVGLNHELARPENKARRDAAWRILSTLLGEEGRRERIRGSVSKGFAPFMNPSELASAGLDAYISQVPENWRRSFKQVEETSLAEPYMGFWWPILSKIDGEVLDYVLTRPDFDYATALRRVETSANTGMMFERKDKELHRWRPVAWAIFAGALAVTLWMLRQMVGSFHKSAAQGARTGSHRDVYHPALPWIMMAPALLSILMWNYYPLAHGSVMAFQDYHILKPSKFVGLDTFINVFLDPDFWTSLLQTVKYVFISLGLTFVGPILLAVLLHEIPRYKTFFRTLFFLPQISSGIVVMMIWMLLYNPTEYGLLNQLIGRLDAMLLHMGLDVTLGRQDWLGDPRWAMIAVVLPSLWSQAGISSLVYLAALKSIDEESYEAAQIDGAGMFHSFVHITIPFLKPLIVINFVSAFIGTFQNMGNILVMTGGGPAQETMVLALRIWLEAYAYLRYSRAVAMAWILGLALIAFTVLQLRILRKVEFRKAQEN